MLFKTIKPSLLPVSLLVLSLPTLSLAVDLDRRTIARQLSEDNKIFVNNQDYSTSHYKYLLSQPKEEFLDVDSDLVFTDYNQTYNEGLRDQYYGQFLQHLTGDINSKDYDDRYISRIQTKIGQYLENDPVKAIEKLIKPGLSTADYRTANLFLSAIQRTLVDHDVNDPNDAVGKQLKALMSKEYTQAFKKYEEDDEGNGPKDAAFHFKKDKSFQYYQIMYGETCGIGQDTSWGVFNAFNKAKASVSKAIWGDIKFQKKKAHQQKAQAAITAARNAAYPYSPSLFKVTLTLTNQGVTALPSLIRLKQALSSRNMAAIPQAIANAEESSKKIDATLDDLNTQIKQGLKSALAAVKGKFPQEEVAAALAAVIEDTAALKEKMEKARSAPAGIRLVVYAVKRQQLQTAADLDAVQDDLDKLESDYEHQVEALGGFNISDSSILLPPDFVRNRVIELLGFSDEEAIEATHNSIQKAYREKSLIMHPDKGGDAEKYSELTTAMGDYNKLYSKK